MRQLCVRECGAAPCWQILTELEYSGVGRNKEQAARMLGHLVSRAPRLIKPYMEPILKVLIPKLKDPDPNPGVLISVLMAIGELAQVRTSVPPPPGADYWRVVD